VRKLGWTALVQLSNGNTLNDEFQITKIPLKSLRLANSPDPADAFMFYAIAKDKIDPAFIGLNIGWKTFRC
jgi:hypothetical protein